MCRLVSIAAMMLITRFRPSSIVAVYMFRFCFASGIVIGLLRVEGLDMAHFTVDLNDAELLARMKNFENHLVERKTIGDKKDWRKTAVAFANSAPVGLPAVLYIGVRDNGDIETPQHNLDEAQKKFNGLMDDVYPRVAYVVKIIVAENGRQALAVIIPGSESRPHFAGLSYVRRGSETFEASEEQFAELIAQRNSKAALILQSKGKNVTVVSLLPDGHIATGEMGRQWPDTTVVVDCNKFYVTLLASPTGVPESLPLSRVEVSRDNLRSRLQLEIRG
jgi:Putative DNA-binding domain